MTSPLRRLRSSTAPAKTLASSDIATNELQSLLQAVRDVDATDDHSAAHPLVRTARELQPLRRELRDAQQLDVKDAFRRLQGFELLLDTLRSVSGYYEPAAPLEDRAKLFEALKVLLGVLAEALDGHHGNRRYFDERAEGGGWTAVEQALASTGLVATDGRGVDELFGCLFACALNDDAVVGLYRDIRRGRANSPRSESHSLSSGGGPSSTTKLDDGSVTVPESEEQRLRVLREFIEHTVGQQVRLRNPEILPTICRFWLALLSHSKEETSFDPLSTSILMTLQHVVMASKHNLAAAHSAGVLSVVLPPLFDDSALPRGETLLLRRFADVLASLGPSNMEDAILLYRNAMMSSEVAEFLLRVLRSSREPAHFHFDLSLHGFSSIELPTLGRVFPPTASSGGYSWAAWIYIDRYDPNLHTTIFGAFDSSQTCFVLAYIEKDTHNLIYQTSVTSAKPSIRFKSIAFKTKRWYHLVLVHSRPRVTSSSKALLFLDGEFVEQLKCPYPSTPPLLNSSTESFASFSSSPKRHNSVQAFLGTSQELSARLGQGVAFSQWSLASFHLFEETLSHDLIAIYYHLGPRYHGNFQDCLGSFQTYEASAALSLRNDAVYPGKEETSSLVSAIRSKAGNILPESRIVLNISPYAVLGTTLRVDIRTSPVVKLLSKRSTGTLLHLTRLGGNTIAFNGAVPSLNDALAQPHGVAILTGAPAVLSPVPFDDVSWRVGGCAAVGLKMIEVATTREEVLCATEILLESVKENWRNSEAMEKENAFGILAILLRNKMGIGRSSSKEVALADPIEGEGEEIQKLSMELLRLVLAFIGYRHEKRADSIIVNPLAYRILLIDFDLWRKAALATQKLYYEQFVVFSLESRSHHFNSKRLFRMRIIRKLLDALKGQPIHSDLQADFVKAFSSLLRFSMSAEILRTLSLFVTYSLHKNGSSATGPTTPGGKPGTPSGQWLRSAGSNGSTSVPSAAAVSIAHGHRELSQVELARMVLKVYTEQLCAGLDTANIKKFARTVTNKWLLYLLAENDSNIVTLGLKILARLLVVHGQAYVNKFAVKTGGFIIMKRELSRWWNSSAVWVMLFAILFGVDVSTVDENNTRLDDLSTIFLKNGEAKVVYQEIFPIITNMLATGIGAVGRDQNRQDDKPLGSEWPSPTTPSQAREDPGSVGLRTAIQVQDKATKKMEDGSVIQTVLDFLRVLHERCRNFRDFATSSTYVHELLLVLYPLIVSSNPARADVELHSTHAAVPIFQDDEYTQEAGSASTQADRVNSQLFSPNSRPHLAQRCSSFILITSHQSQRAARASKMKSASLTKRSGMVLRDTNSPHAKSLLDLIITVFFDQIFGRKEFPGFGLFFKAPPGLPEHRVPFESYVLRHTVLRLHEKILTDRKLLLEPSVLNNIARAISHLSDAILEGWFNNGIEPLLDFAGNVLDYLQEPEVAKLKSIKLCNQAVLTIRSVFLVLVLLKLSALNNLTSDEKDTLSFLNQLLYWQTILFKADSSKPEFVKLLWYLLYAKLVGDGEEVRLAVANFWRILLIHKPAETTGILDHKMTTNERMLLLEFQKLKEVDDGSFLRWVDERREDLDTFFIGTLTKVWEEFVSEENQRTLDSAKARTNKRKEKLKQWAFDEANAEDTLRRHEVACHHWMANIYASERLKYQRATQDQQDNYAFNVSKFEKLDDDLTRPCGLLEDDCTQKWRLDETEGRNRMRLRLLPDAVPRNRQYQPKPKQQGQHKSSSSLQIDVRTRSRSSASSIGTASLGVRGTSSGSNAADHPKDPKITGMSGELVGADDDFELIEDPRDDGEGFEDKNRMVLRSLQRGDQVEYVYNVSRIIGLEACEGLLIVGKDSLYLLDNFFHRSDGEIVGVSQAPKDERDPYLQMISGRQFKEGDSQLRSLRSESRHWVWTEVVSISKRRFLFRDVAIEVFFTDGRSYLLTSFTPAIRDELYLRLAAKAPHVRRDSITPNSEDIWRLEALKSLDDLPQTFGSKIANAFNSGHAHPATQRWIRGEISNFHYLMLVNTMAGRTFNDLTQYPVFPWVLADYTSEELDLTDPTRFRDLSKPMGAQSAQRQAEFRERYKAFADLSDLNAPPFHYGTHYSSAMIVTSYLIRLQPFVQSYLLLQGGNFDHADRMFFSIEKAWKSASREHMTDVRELIPEFFYLPEFLENLNDYNFGLRQGTGEPIDSVALPPWAKGDPKIFIAKHREALESPFVSKNLHHWIDLVFGSKQRGEAAVEATNVFHHLSYHGAKDLDSIEDSMERLATIGIIHNFGQTPHQVFHKGHPSREVVHNRLNRLDTLIDSLARRPISLLDSGERVSSLLYSDKEERLLCAGAFRLNVPPDYDRYMEWGFVDNSVRFYQADNRKLLGLFEHMHQKQLSCALFADSKTLVTAGTDCTLAVWAITSSSKAVDIQAKTTLFGHRSPVTVLATSRSYGVLVSVATDGQALLWDLNRCQFVRRLASGESVECARINDVTGDIMLCRRQTVSLYTLNGQLLLEQRVCDSADDYIGSCTFYEGGGVEWLERELVFTGHTRGLVKVWTKVIRDGHFHLDLIKRLEHVDHHKHHDSHHYSARSSGGHDEMMHVDSRASITCILPTFKSVYTGDEDGKVVSVFFVQPRERI